MYQYAVWIISSSSVKSRVNCYIMLSNLQFFHVMGGCLAVCMLKLGILVGGLREAEVRSEDASAIYHVDERS